MTERDGDKVSGRETQLVTDLYTPEIPEWAKSPNWESETEIFVIVRVTDNEDGDGKQLEVFASLPDNDLTLHTLRMAADTVSQSVEHEEWMRRYGRPRSD